MRSAFMTLFAGFILMLAMGQCLGKCQSRVRAMGSQLPRRGGTR